MKKVVRRCEDRDFADAVELIISVTFSCVVLAEITCTWFLLSEAASGLPGQQPMKENKIIIIFDFLGENVNYCNL